MNGASAGSVAAVPASTWLPRPGPESALTTISPRRAVLCTDAQSACSSAGGTGSPASARRACHSRRSRSSSSAPNGAHRGTPRSWSAPSSGVRVVCRPRWTTRSCPCSEPGSTDCSCGSSTSTVLPSAVRSSMTSASREPGFGGLPSSREKRRDMPQYRRDEGACGGFAAIRARAADKFSRRSSSRRHSTRCASSMVPHVRWEHRPDTVYTAGCLRRGAGSMPTMTLRVIKVERRIHAPPSSNCSCSGVPTEPRLRAGCVQYVSATSRLQRPHTPS